MRKLPPLVITVLIALQTVGMAQSNHTEKTISPKIFLVDQTKPYVYLQVDHIGPGKPQREDEPKQRIWLRLHNNCIVPIVLHLFGKDAILDDVVANPPPSVGDGGSIPNEVPAYPMPPDVTKALGFPETKVPPPQPKASSMPQGYFSYVASFETIGAGQSIYFSIPINQVSSQWHVEIPFSFDLDVQTELQGPHQFIALYEDEVAAKVGSSGLP